MITTKKYSDQEKFQFFLNIPKKYNESIEYQVTNRQDFYRWLITLRSIQRVFFWENKSWGFQHLNFKANCIGPLLHEIIERYSHFNSIFLLSNAPIDANKLYGIYHLSLSQMTLDILQLQLIEKDARGFQHFLFPIPSHHHQGFICPYQLILQNENGNEGEGKKSIMIHNYFMHIGFHVFIELYSNQYISSRGFRNQFLTLKNEEYPLTSNQIKETGFENVFQFDSSFFFGFVLLENVDYLANQEKYDLYLQNKILALEGKVSEKKGLGGIFIIDGIPSTKLLNWIIQKNVQALPLCPHVEILILLTIQTEEDLDLPYLLTIKKANHFRWKKDNFERFLNFVNENVDPEERPILRKKQKKIQEIYQSHKELIKLKLKWTSAAEVMIQLNKTRSETTNPFEEFWKLLDSIGKDKPKLSSIMNYSREENSKQSLNEFIDKEIRLFLSWLVNIANNQKESVPPQVCAVLPRDRAINRLKRIDPSCVSSDRDGVHQFPSESIVQEKVKIFTPLFERVLEGNANLPSSLSSPLFHLPMEAVISDFFADVLYTPMKSSAGIIRNLADLTPEHLEEDFKKQLIYAQKQIGNIFHHYPTCAHTSEPRRTEVIWNSISQFEKMISDETAKDSSNLQLSYETKRHEIIVNPSTRFESLEEMTKELENCFLQTYCLIMFSLKDEEQEQLVYKEHFTTLLDTILSTFHRGSYLKSFFNIIYQHHSKQRILPTSFKFMERSIDEVLKKVKHDTKFQTFYEYKNYYNLFFGFIANLFGKNVDEFQNLMSTQALAISNDSTAIDAGIVKFMEKIRPISELLPNIENILYPIFFESCPLIPFTSCIHPKTDKILAIILPSVSFEIAWVKYIYIIDINGNVLLTSETCTGKQKGMRFFHSQLSQWKPVLAAGEMYFTQDQQSGQWKCVHINNGSGHYSPDAEKSLIVAKKWIVEGLKNTSILCDNPELADVLLPGAPSHSYLEENGFESE